MHQYRCAGLSNIGTAALDHSYRKMSEQWSRQHEAEEGARGTLLDYVGVFGNHPGSSVPLTAKGFFFMTCYYLAGCSPPVCTRVGARVCGHLSALLLLRWDCFDNTSFYWLSWLLTGREISASAEKRACGCEEIHGSILCWPTLSSLTIPQDVCQPVYVKQARRTANGAKCDFI